MIAQEATQPAINLLAICIFILTCIALVDLFNGKK